MKWIDYLEVKFGRMAVPGLLRIVVAFNALVFVLYKINPEFIDLLSLDPVRIAHGEVWRLVSYIFIPQFGSMFSDYLSVLLYLWFLWFVGDGLEHSMGAFRLNLYFLTGMIGTTVAAFFFGGNFSNAMITSSLFYAFARFYPDMEIYLFFILPVKVRWMAWAFAVFLLFGFVTGSMSYRMAVAAALANYLIFFGAEIYRDARHRKTVTVRRREFEKAAEPESPALHCCAVCGRTEISHPELDFRVGSDGNDYCAEHLKGKAGR